MSNSRQLDPVLTSRPERRDASLSLGAGQKVDAMLVDSRLERAGRQGDISILIHLPELFRQAQMAPLGVVGPASTCCGLALFEVAL